MELEELAVGKVYKRVAGKPETVYVDHPNTFEIVCHFNRPTEKELASMKSDAPFEIRFVTVRGILFFVFKCGSESWQDAAFAPQICGNKQFEEIEDGKGYGLTLMCTDAPSGTVKSLRLIGLGTEFSRALRAEILRLLDEPFNLSLHYSKVNEIYAAYSTNDLMRMASSHRWKC